MHVLVLHSDVAADAAPDEQDTLIQAEAITDALQKNGHVVTHAPFLADRPAFMRLLKAESPDLVFNLVETVWGEGRLASLAPAFLAASGVPFTGVGVGVMTATGDKLLSKRLMTAASVETAAWSEPPHWGGLDRSSRWIVKSADEDASLGLDDASVVPGGDVASRAKHCAATYGGRWFAEAYVDGREFNVAVLERNGDALILPIAEMRFENWRADRPRIVGYGAKWDAGNRDFHDTVRGFSWAQTEPVLRNSLADTAAKCWHLFGLTGYARVDLRVDTAGRPFVLEVNANPCLSPDAGFPAAASEAGMSYVDLIEHIVRAAVL